MNKRGKAEVPKCNMYAYIILYSYISWCLALSEYVSKQVIRVPNSIEIMELIGRDEKKV